MDSATMPSKPPTSLGRHHQERAAARPPEHGARPAIDLDIREPEEPAERRRGLLGRSAADDDALESHRGLHRGLRGHRGGELDQHAMAGARMQKGNASGQPLARRHVEQRDALAPERGEILIHARGPEAQVMQPLSPLGEEARDSGVGGRRLEQLDLAVAGGEQRGAHALIGDLRLADERQAKRVAPEAIRLVEASSRRCRRDGYR
jgi:hypothetical protein